MSSTTLQQKSKIFYILFFIGCDIKCYKADQYQEHPIPCSKHLLVYLPYSYASFVTVLFIFTRCKITIRRKTVFSYVKKTVGIDKVWA